MSNSKRMCKHCKSFQPVEEMVKINAGWYCNHDHAILWATARARKDVLKRNKRKHAEAKEKLKTRAEWLRDFQAVFNKYVRIRDINDGCISCDKGKDWQGQWHASHLYSRGHSSSLRFNLWNVHKSCSRCNSHLSGNIGEYTPRLIEKIGQDRFDWLTANKATVKRHEIDWLKRAIVIFRKKIKRLNNRNTEN